jgi:hypothetical protein
MRVLLEGFASPDYGDGLDLRKWCGIAGAALLNGALSTLIVFVSGYILGPVRLSTLLAIWAGTAALSAVCFVVLTRLR